MNLIVHCVNSLDAVGVNHVSKSLVTLRLPSECCTIENHRKYADEVFKRLKAQLGCLEFSEMVVCDGDYGRYYLFTIQYLLTRVRIGNRQIKMNASMLAWMMKQQIQEVRDEYENERLKDKALFSYITKGDN